MKNFIFRFIFSGCLFAFGLDATAQIGIGIGTGGIGVGFGINPGRNNPERRIEKQVREMKKDFDLTPEQEKEVRSLLIERDRSRQSRKHEPMTMMEFDGRMKEILTEEQYVNYTERKQERKDDVRSGKSRQREQKDDLPESQWDDVYR